MTSGPGVSSGFVPLPVVVPPRDAVQGARTVSSPRVSPVTANISPIASLSVAFNAAAGEGSPNHRRNFMRRQRMEYLRNQRGQGGPGQRTHVLTDPSGNVTALKTVLNRAIRDIVGRVLDVSLKEFNHHPSMAFELIDHDIHSQFSFDPPLRAGYIKLYLQDALSWTQNQWRSYWKKNGSRHPQCPAKRYSSLVALWMSEASQQESERMRIAWEHRAAGGGDDYVGAQGHQDKNDVHRGGEAEEVHKSLYGHAAGDDKE